MSSQLKPAKDRRKLACMNKCQQIENNRTPRTSKVGIIRNQIKNNYEYKML